MVADAGFAGTVVRIATTGVLPDVSAEEAATCGGVLVTVAAGEPWDDFVARAVDAGWVGHRGALGHSRARSVRRRSRTSAPTARRWRRRSRRSGSGTASSGVIRTFANAECGFGYRHSRFKADPGRFVVLSVTYQFRQGSLGAPVGYAELARTLGVEPGSRAPMAEVRSAVLALRAGKGMVLDEQDHDTWSAGSFFTNPVIAPELVPDGRPGLAPARRQREDQRRLADRARGLREGPRHRAA